MSTSIAKWCKYLFIAAALPLAGCGTFQLASGVYPLSAKTTEQQQLDNLSCKDQAKLEANTAERQAGAFALGFTIVGLPLAYELEKSKQREVYKGCMEAKGYRVIAPNDGPASASAPAPAPAPPLPTAPPLATLNPAPKPPATVAPAPAPATAAAPAPAPTPATQARDEAAALQTLEELRDKGLISRPCKTPTSRMNAESAG